MLSGTVPVHLRLFSAGVLACLPLIGEGLRLHLSHSADGRLDGPEIDAIVDEVVQPRWLGSGPRASLYAGEPLNASLGSRFLVIACHHKTGTELLRDLAKYQSEVLRQPCASNTCEAHKTPCSNFPPTVHVEPHPQLFFMCHVNSGLLGTLKRASNRNWRAVHVVRDPVAIVVSGYVYHMHVDDFWGGTEQIRTMSLADGIEVEAEVALRTSIKEMVDVVQWGAAESDMMALPFENLTGSSAQFDASVREMYAFLGNTGRAAETLGERAKQLDLNRGNTPVGGDNHVSSVNLKRMALQALGAISNATLARLRTAQVILGYAAWQPPAAAEHKRQDRLAAEQPPAAKRRRHHRRHRH